MGRGFTHIGVHSVQLVCTLRGCVAPSLVGIQPAPAWVRTTAGQPFVQVRIRHSHRVDLGCNNPNAIESIRNKPTTAPHEVVPFMVSHRTRPSTRPMNNTNEPAGNTVSRYCRDAVTADLNSAGCKQRQTSVNMTPINTHDHTGLPWSWNPYQGGHCTRHYQSRRTTPTQADPSSGCVGTR